MAHHSSKKIAAQNTKTLHSHLYAILATSLLYILARFFVFAATCTYKHILAFTIVECVLLALYLHLSWLANHHAIHLADPASLVAYYFDVLYIAMFVLLATAVLGDVFWYTLCVIPAYALYKFWDKLIKPFVASPVAPHLVQDQPRRRNKK
ncbi:hypothetical protein SeMB42_g06699 [Synchytrium endobioticum]|uniref:Uncharacterized protein n=1 Tax=Synchytrium endobioticum TaxID=286115 RepID=A0A507CNB5_9FUNG|nr:hypothetical protein SeMB42_g06699 [Synchytrium endobioticum]TPX40614.1 hypothetical protein SeLEV6574_g06532 [Synchytrium endobioticum]